MTLQQFVEQFADAIQANSASLHSRMRLADIAEFDSMGRLCVISLIDARFGFVIPIAQFEQSETIGDLFECARQGASVKEHPIGNGKSRQAIDEATE